MTDMTTDSALVEALEPFAREADTWWDQLPDDARPWIAEPGNSGGDDAQFTVGDLRRLRHLYQTLSQPAENAKGGEVVAHEMDKSGKPTADSDPWFQLGWHKEKLEWAESELQIWKVRAMSLRLAHPAKPVGLREALHTQGWRVAVHNDYRLNGEDHTFWLFTHADGRWIKGEGRTDAEALAQCLALATPARTDDAGRPIYALPDCEQHKWGWEAARIDGVWCVGMKGNLHFGPDATLKITGGFLSDGDAEQLAHWIVAKRNADCEANLPPIWERGAGTWHPGDDA